MDVLLLVVDAMELDLDADCAAARGLEGSGDVGEFKVELGVDDLRLNILDVIMSNLLLANLESSDACCCGCCFLLFPNKL
jgi:hypothetical protein